MRSSSQGLYLSKITDHLALVHVPTRATALKAASTLLFLFVCFVTDVVVAVQEVVLGDLKADTSYSVSVGAYTAKGDGARSKPVTVCSALPRKWGIAAHSTELVVSLETRDVSETSPSPDLISHHACIGLPV